MRADGSPKVAFDSQAEAERASLFARLEHGSDVLPYRCDVCGRWHLASAGPPGG